jgi:hypothetical protein
VAADVNVAGFEQAARTEPAATRIVVSRALARSSTLRMSSSVRYFRPPA